MHEVIHSSRNNMGQLEVRNTKKTSCEVTLHALVQRAGCPSAAVAVARAGAGLVVTWDGGEEAAVLARELGAADWASAASRLKIAGPAALLSRTPRRIPLFDLSGSSFASESTMFAI